MLTYARSAEEDEIRRVLQVCAPSFHDQSFNEPARIAELASKFAKAARVLVAYEQGEPRGFCAYYANDVQTHTAYVSMIVVARGMQGRSVGSRLIAQAADDARACGMTRMRLEVACDNEGALRFYRRHGFVEESVRGDHLFLARPL